MVVNHIKGAHGAGAQRRRLPTPVSLREKLELEGSIFHTTSDTEVISYLITRERLKLRSHRGGRFPRHEPHWRARIRW